jgi:hypothetical protein
LDPTWYRCNSTSSTWQVIDQGNLSCIILYHLIILRIVQFFSLESTAISSSSARITPITKDSV